MIQRLLVTGGAGFIGSTFILTLLRSRGDIRIVNLDALTYAGDPENLSSAAGDPRYAFVRGDIGDRELVGSLFARHGFDAVVHFAAESHVDRSIRDPGIFVRTNVLGTHCLLECARAAWRTDGDGQGRPAYRPGVRFAHISTDEVYGPAGPAGSFDESAPLRPSNPYSASKASADLLALSYAATYGLPVVVTRSSNNYGPRQHAEKLIPLMIARALAMQPLPVYGDGLQVRDWLHVEDNCRAILAALERGRPGEVYNVGGGCEKTNLEIVRMILATLSKPETLIRRVADRPGHDRRYALDCSKITRELEWSPDRDLESGLRETVRWYAEHPARLGKTPEDPRSRAGGNPDR